MFVSYAQAGEDVVLWRALDSVDRGTYVDVGAAHPSYDSVTRAFYERGWTGVNVEPQPDFAKALREARPLDRTYQVAAGRERGWTTLHSVPGTGLSTVLDDHVAEIREAFEVVDIEAEVRTLDELLEDANLATPIHFMKVDVEGAEAQVLAGLNLDAWRPWVLVVESTIPMGVTSTHESWEPGLVAAGYRFCMFDGLNRFYSSPDHPELVPLLSYPAGVRDDFQLAGDLERAFNDIRLQLDRLNQAYLQLQSARDSERLETARLLTSVHHLTDELQRLDDAARASDSAAVLWRGRSLKTTTELNALRHETARTRDESASLREQLRREEEARAAMVRTVSWRVTKPLRSVRSFQLERKGLPIQQPLALPVARTSGARASTASDAAMHTLRQRLGIVVGLLDPAGAVNDGGDPTAAAALSAFETAITRSEVSPRTVGWLGAVAATGAYPTTEEHERLTRTLRRRGTPGLTAVMEELFENALGQRDELPALELIEDRVLIDVSHTVRYDLHTGIQRVTRECASRWVDRSEAVLVHWNDQRLSIAALADSEVRRMRGWRDQLELGGAVPQMREPEERNGSTVVPWRCTLLIPELAAEPGRSSAYRAVTAGGVISELSLVGYDAIPMTATEVVAEGMTGMYANFVSMAKYASNMSAISKASGREFAALCTMFESQGMTGPRVTSTQLPSTRPDLADADLKAARKKYLLGPLPLVLVVGSHEPRKNHVAVLEAAERLWKEKIRFELLFVGGSGWKSEPFDRYIEELQDEGLPVSVHKRVDETALWALFRLARFTVFPSLMEGYGLPIAESLVSGTPVITSNYGSMAEVAAGGGTLLVDPRDPECVHAAMNRLLVDDCEHRRLVAEAVARRWPTWDEYANTLWGDLVQVPHH
jgi:FkbM family methyltransferase